MNHTAALVGGAFCAISFLYLMSLVVQALIDKTFRITNIIFEEALTISGLATFLYMLLIWAQYFAR